jgi:amino acid transporter
MTTPSGLGGHSLRRSVGVATAVATSAGLAFAAIDYLGVVSIATFAAGSSGWIAILVAAIVVLLVAAVFSELNGMYPTAAGIRLYIGRAIGNRFAMTATFTYMSTVVLVIAADAFLIGAAIQHVLHEPSAVAYIWIVALLGLALVANLFGIKLAGWVQTIVTYTVLASTVVLSVIAIVKPGHFDHPFGLFRDGPLSGMQAIAFGLFLFAAFEWVTTTAEEARTPKVIPRALFIAPFLIWLASTTFYLGLTHLVPVSVAHGSPYPQLLMGRAALGAIGEIWMLAVTILTALNTFNGGFLVASRFIYAAAREGSLPKSFAKLNMRAVPWLAVVTLAVASAILAAVVFATGQWLLLVGVGATLEAAIYAIACWCVVALRKKDKSPREFPMRGGAKLAMVGVVIFGLLAVLSGFADPKDPKKFSVLPIAIILVLGGISWSYVAYVVPRMRTAAAAKAPVAAPKRRPQRPAPSETVVEATGTDETQPD